MARIQVEKSLGSTRRCVMSGLLAFNKSVVGKSDYKPLAVALRQGKNIVGGLSGWSWKGGCYVEALWIEECFRSKGYGTALMREVELELRKRGVSQIFLDTFSFQSPAFYAKLGFRRFATLKDFPKGYSRQSFVKAL
jgi:ribosomal protein S18 acetylase RimI-like enzyme